MLPILILVALLQGSPFLELVELTEGGVSSPRIAFSDLGDELLIHESELGEEIEGRTLVLHPR